MDLNECVEPKQFHDVVGGGYQRYDVFDLNVTRVRQSAEFALAAVQEPELNGFALQNDGAADLPEQPAARSRPLMSRVSKIRRSLGSLPPFKAFDLRSPSTYMAISFRFSGSTSWPFG